MPKGGEEATSKFRGDTDCRCYGEEGSHGHGEQPESTQQNEQGECFPIAIGLENDRG